MALVEARLRSLLEERGVRYDIVEALLAAPWDNIADVMARANVLTAMVAEGKNETVTAATRPRNILRTAKDPIPDTPDTTYLTAPAEQELLAVLATVKPEVEAGKQTGDFGQIRDSLNRLTTPINTLFDAVMIMDSDPVIRTARLGLLAEVDRLFLTLADFSKLVAE